MTFPAGIHSVPLFEHGLCVTVLASPAQALWLFLKGEIPRQHFLPSLQVWGSVAVSTVQSAQGAGGGKLQLQQEFRNSLGQNRITVQEKTATPGALGGLGGSSLLQPHISVCFSHHEDL